MKTRKLFPAHSSCAAALAVLVAIFVQIAAPSAFAATYYYDNNTSTSGFGTAGGTWASPTPGPTPGWTTSTTGTTVPGSVSTTTNDLVNFGNGATGLGAGTITVSGSVSNANMTFASGSRVIVLSGGTIVFTNNATITVNNSSDTISSVLSGAAGPLTKAGAGTLYLSASNTYTATNTIISAGVLALGNVNAIPSTSGLTFNSGVLGLAAGNYTNSQGSITASVAQPGRFQFSSNGGWAAYGADRTVNSGGAGGFLGFGSGNVGTVIGTLNGKVLILGAADATHKVTFVNGLDVGGATRTVQVNDGPAAVDAEISGVVRGAVGFGTIKTGNGTLALSGSNTITGDLTVSAGTLVGALSTPDNSATATAFGDATLSTRTITVTNGATLRFDNANVMTHNFGQPVLPALSITGGTVLNNVAGNNALANVTLNNGTLTATTGHANYGAFNLNGTITTTGASTISTSDPTNGRMMLNGSGANGVDTPTVINVQSGTLTVSAPLAQVTIESKISGLTKSGTGTLVLSGANTYSGVTTISGGTLLGVVGGACSNSAVTVNDTAGCTLGVFVNDSTKQWTCASLTSAGANATLAFAFSTPPSTSLAPLKVTGTLTFAGVPAITVDRANLVPGQAYPLIVCGGTPPSETPAVTVGRGFTASMVWIGNTLWLTNLTGTSTLPLTWATSPSGDWDINTTQNWKDNTGAAAYYTEGIITADTVRFDDTYVIADTTVTLNTTVKPGSVTVSNSAYNYTITGSGAISGGIGLTKTGSGTLSISNANTFTGGVNINTGTLVLGNGSALGATNANTVIAAGATLDLAGITGAQNNPVIVSGGGTTGTNAITSTVPIASPFIGLRFVTLSNDTVLNADTRWDIGNNATGGVLIGNGYKLTVCGTNDLSLNILVNTDLGDVVVSNRALYIQGNTTLGRTANTVSVYPGSSLNLYGAGVNINKPLALNGGTLADGNSTPTYSGPIAVNADSTVSAVAAFTLSGAISGTGGLTFSSGAANGTFILSGTNSGYTRNISVVSLLAGLSTLQINASTAAPGGGTITLNYPATAASGSSSTLNLQAGVSLPAAVTLNMTSTNDTGISRRTQVTSAGAASVDGPITLSGDNLAQFTPASGSTLTLNGNTTVNGAFTGTMFVRGVGNGFLNGTVNIPTASLAKTDAGTWTVNSTGNVWTNTLVAVGTVKIGTNNALATTAPVLMGQGDANAASLDLNGFNQTVGGLLHNVGASGVRQINNTSGTLSTLTVDTAATSTYTYGTASIAILAGNLALVKTGSGTQTLAGINTYTGSTTVSNGTLAVSGLVGGTTTTVASGATLAFSGSGGVISPTIVLAGGATLDFSGASATPSLSSGQTLSAGPTMATINGSVNTASGNVVLAYAAGTPPLQVTSGTLTLSGSTAITVNNTGPLLQPGTYLIVQANGGTVGGTLPPVAVGGFGAVGAGSLSIDGSGNLYLIIGPAVVWTGASDTSWLTGGNWNTTASPNPGDAVNFNNLSTNNLATVLNASFTLAAVNVLNPAGPVSIDAGGANTLTVSNGINLAAATQGLTVSAPVVLGAAQPWTVTNGRTLAVSGPVSGTPVLTVAGGGTVLLSATNTYSGGTTISGGTLTIGGAGQLGSGNYPGSISQNGVFNYASSANQTLAGAISGAGSVTKTSSSTLTLTGTNTYSGGTTVSAGALIGSLQTNFNSIGTGAVSISSGATNQVNNLNTVNITPVLGNAFTGSGRLIVNFATNTTARNTTISGVTNFIGTIQLASAGTNGDKWNIGNSGLNTPGLTVQVDSGNTAYFPSSNSVFAGITLSGPGNSENRGALRLSSSASVGGPMTLSGDATIASDSTATLPPTLTGNISATSANALTSGHTSAGGNLILSGILSDGAGTLSLAKTTAGTLTLSGANTFSGAVSLNAGILVVSNNTALGNTAGSTTVASGAELQLGNGITVTGETATILGSGVNFGGALRTTTGANATWAGPIIIGNSASRVGAAAGTTLTVTGGIQGSDTNQSISITGGAS